MTNSSRDCSAAARFGVCPLRCRLIDSHSDSDSGPFTARSSTLLSVHTSIRSSHLVYRLCRLLNRTANIRSCSAASSHSRSMATLSYIRAPANHSSLPAEERTGPMAVLNPVGHRDSSFCGCGACGFSSTPGAFRGRAILTTQGAASPRRDSYLQLPAEPPAEIGPGAVGRRSLIAPCP